MKKDVRFSGIGCDFPLHGTLHEAFIGMGIDPILLGDTKQDPILLCKIKLTKTV